MCMGNMSVDKMSVDKMSVDKMSVDKMSVDKMSVDNLLQLLQSGLSVVRLQTTAPTRCP